MFCLNYDCIKCNIINKFLLVGDKCMSEVHLRQPGLPIVLEDHLQKIKKEYKSLNKL